MFSASAWSGSGMKNRIFRSIHSIVVLGAFFVMMYNNLFLIYSHNEVEELKGTVLTSTC